MRALCDLRNLPTANQLADWREAISRHSALPIPVINTIEALPHDAHPMGVILAGLNALSLFHPEQNPALAGNGIYQNKDVQDKQIVRIFGEDDDVGGTRVPSKHRSETSAAECEVVVTRKIFCTCWTLV